MLQQEFVRYEKPIDILIGLEPDQVSLHPLGHDAFIRNYIFDYPP